MTARNYDYHFSLYHLNLSIYRHAEHRMTHTWERPWSTATREESNHHDASVSEEHERAFGLFPTSFLRWGSPSSHCID